MSSSTSALPSSSATATAVHAPYASSSSSQNHILAEKVMQTLQIPTDTPAMQAAWEALASLSSYYNNHSSSQGVVDLSIDAKSVRTAVEMDALHQALLFQSQLKTLTDQVHQMKLEIQTVGDTASQLLTTLEPCTTTMITTVSDDYISTSQSSFEAEQQLAYNIAQAFARRDQAQVYYSTLVDFLQQYELTGEEGQLLDTFQLQEWITNPDVGVLHRGMEFLHVLDKIQDIRIQLMQRLEGGGVGGIFDSEQSNSSSSLESVSTSTLRMMKTLMSRQEQAYQRLYQSLCSLLQVDHTSAAILGEEFYSHAFFGKALSILHRHVPAYYTHIVDLFAHARRSLVTKNFLIALTTGTTSPESSSGGTTTVKSMSAPLERMAHDPVTYVGDMLAHVFQCLSDERDLVRSCLMSTLEQDEEENKMNEKKNDKSSDSDSRQQVYRVLNHIVGGVIRPLRGRIHAVFESLTRRSTQEEDDDGEDSDEEMNWIRDPMDPNAFISDGAHSSSIRRLACLYSICGLLIFYHEKMKNSLGALGDTKQGHPTDEFGGSSLEESNDPSLIRGIVDCLKEGVDSFSISLKVYTAILQQSQTQTVSSSQSTKSHTRHVQELIHSLCVVNNTSPGFAMPWSNTFPDDSALYLSNIGDVVLGAALSSCDVVDDVSTLRLLLEDLTLAGVPADRISPWEESFLAKERTLIDSLISKETLLVLDRIGLGEAVKALKNSVDDGNFSPQYTALSPQRVQTALTRFYSALRSSSPIPTYEEQIKDVKLRKYARSMIADGIIEAYTRLYSFMNDHLRDAELQRYTPDQVRSLLAI